MTKAEAWDIFEHFKRCCICVGAVAPSTFWSTINNFPCYHHIGNEIRDLNDYIKNCGDTKLAIAIDEFICAYQAGDEDIYNVLLVMAYYADDMESEIAQEIQVGVEYLQKIHEWLMISEFKVKPQRVFDYHVKNGKLTLIKKGKAKRYKTIDKLTPEIVRLFIARIEIGERTVKYSRHSAQKIRIIYRDIGEWDYDDAAEAEQQQPQIVAVTVTKPELLPA